mmetsp:Transcript_5524/g.18287  ORF Transcript_5524/g.18287 Transcript_5524/m.18287 type:complete len:232 (+) Transcript_5524:49-744(+)
MLSDVGMSAPRRPRPANAHNSYTKCKGAGRKEGAAANARRLPLAYARRPERRYLPPRPHPPKPALTDLLLLPCRRACHGARRTSVPSQSRPVMPALVRGPSISRRCVHALRAPPCLAAGGPGCSAGTRSGTLGRPRCSPCPPPARKSHRSEAASERWRIGRRRSIGSTHPAAGAAASPVRPRARTPQTASAGRFPPKRPRRRSRGLRPPGQKSWSASPRGSARLRSPARAH